MSYGFHSSNGLFFKGDAEGNVIIRKVEAEEVLFEVTLDENTWASAVASVCGRGETAETFREACAFHSLERQEIGPEDVGSVEDIL